ncbi:MAG TPA: hypothetical protein VGE07_01990 [Herpetosiphonaceae bacterium]
MTDLPLRRLVLYKHGVGYFERRGSVEGTTLALPFSREAMDDVLKSLVVLELGEGRVRGIDYERPESWSGRRIELGHGQSLRDLFRELRGRRVRVSLKDEVTADGLVLGIEEAFAQDGLAGTLVSIFRPDVRQIAIYKLGDIRGVQLLDAAADEIAFALRSGVESGQDRAATIQLDPGKHELLVAYLAPAPSWRVSYRLLIEVEEEGPPTVLLQGWGLFDNVLNEDLSDVRLSLVAGRPVSFRYQLYEPNQPVRPMIRDEAPPPVLPAPKPAPRMMRKGGGGAMEEAEPLALAFSMDDLALDADEIAAFGGADMDAIAQAGASAAEGAAQGALFRYDVREPVSVGRGRSALVPLLNLRTHCRRDLLYRGRVGERHPMATVRFDNSSGLALERGPATVIEQRSYGGEAVIDWTADGGEVRVRYALALEVTVREDVSTEQRLRRLRLGRDALIHELEESLTTIYTARNTGGEDRVVVIEHPRRHPYELFETAQPEELRSDLATWSLPVSARGESALRVRERRLVERRESLRSLTLEQLRRYLHDRMLDQTTVAELRDVLALYARLDAITQELVQVEARRKKLYDQQTQIRGNLNVLKGEGEEGELRTRYIAALGQAEDRLAALAEEETALRQEEEERREELARLLRAFGEPRSH